MADLTTLPTELVLAILAFCDTSCVISISQTCTSFRSIALTKSLWVDIVARLRGRGFIDHRAAPDLTQLFVPQLVELVKRAVVGPASWSPTPAPATGTDTDSFAPRVREHTKIYPHLTNFNAYHRVQLVRGGEHLLVLNSGVLECYDVAQGQRIWADQPASPEYHVNDFAVERGTLGNLVLAMKFMHMGVRLRTCYEIVELDVRTGSAKQLCWLQIEELDAEGVNIVNLSGSILVSSFSTEEGLVVLDWRNLALAYIDADTQSASANAALVENCLALVTRHDDMQRLLVFDLPSISARLSPIERHGGSTVSFTSLQNIPLSSLSPVLTFDIPGGTGSFHSISSFWMYPHPLLEDAYRIWASINAPALPRPGLVSLDYAPPTVTLHRLSLSLPRTNPNSASVRLLGSRSTNFWGAHRLYRDITFSGHAERPSAVLRVTATGGESGSMLVVDSKGRRGTFDLSGYLGVEASAGHVVMSEYSGAWTYTTSEEVLVLYFE
ncbi:hypothetical protein MKEN_01372000 [Mycena kentingensis (nom. inval.)]|nr:hypothetical protein MKEN_01372000 [Mycena kentingensis (nom. inval.)]